MHPVPIVPSATLQTIVRPLLLNAERPATTIAIAGSQKTSKALHGRARMSRDLHVVLPGSTDPSVGRQTPALFYNLECEAGGKAKRVQEASSETSGKRRWHLVSARVSACSITLSSQLREMAISLTSK